MQYFQGIFINQQTLIIKIIEMVMYFKTALEVNVLKVNGIFGIV